IKVSKKPADRDHPFGHGRAELIASLVIGMLLIFIAFNFLTESINRLKTHQDVNYGIIALIAVITSIAVKEGLAQFAIWAGKKTGSNTLKADGWHHRTDAISSVLILIGIIAGRYFWWIDGVLGIIVTMMIAWAAYKILQDAIHPLLGEKPSENLKHRLQQLSRETVGFDPEIHHIHLHRYGDHVELTFHITLPPDMSLKRAHEHVESLEQKIQEELQMTPTIHTDPSGMEEKD
ncbi:MAG: cation diffusion facilitator family transporter, partial [Bacteroidota bacterium]